MIRLASEVGAQPYSRKRKLQGQKATYLVPEGGVLDRVLSSQGYAAEQDEEEDQVGEDGIIDDTVALEAKPARDEGWEGTHHKYQKQLPSSQEQ